MLSPRHAYVGGCRRLLSLGSCALALSLCPTPVQSEPIIITVDSGTRWALERHEDLRVARARVAGARQGVREARADLLPQVSASVSYTRNWLLPTIVFNDQSLKIGSDNSAAGALTLSQSLYSGGASLAALEAARHRVAADVEQRRVAEQDTRARVEAAIYDYLLYGEMVQVSQLRLDLARTSLAQAQALRQAGRVPEYDVIRARVQVASARADSIGAANNMSVAEARLKDTIGLELDLAIEVRARFRDATVLPVDDVGRLVGRGLSGRPEWLALTAQLDAARRHIGVVRAESRPTLDLVASGQMQFQNDKLDELTNGQEWRRSWSTGLAFRMPLFDGMRTGARVARARVEVDRLEALQKQLRRAIELEIRTAQLGLTESVQRLAARQVTVEEARRGLEIAQARYRTGAGTQLEVLDAQVVLVQAEADHARARRDRAVALVSVERAVGALGESALSSPG